MKCWMKKNFNRYIYVIIKKKILIFGYFLFIGWFNLKKKLKFFFLLKKDKMNIRLMYLDNGEEKLNIGLMYVDNVYY